VGDRGAIAIRIGLAVSIVTGSVALGVVIGRATAPECDCQAEDLTAQGCTALAVGLDERLRVCVAAADRVIREIEMDASACEAELATCKQLCGLQERNGP